ncbi:DUF6802 family protein [Haloactinomyces albus]|uniref:DUF6802 domain-containing protein n=1 Tax=Haloactinomyces albus TaxID=1352928 RepID=A0AAE4CNK5_9ACTN|nr:DUF6802 family protein [Haloactinomyces albus]MDR7302127.1 hypothetical protein [Haloactinomyces albus]
MYVEDTGAGDGDIRVTVEGEEYTAEANYDLDGNGIDETAAMMTEDHFVAYTDQDADGAADIMRTVDSEGTVVARARYEEAAGHWVSERPQQRSQQQSQQPHRQQPADDEPPGQAGAGSMTVDTPQGDRRIGPPTEDTDNDGRPDTAIVHTGSGRLMVTDVDGDGSADQVVEISDTGEVTVVQHTGDGQWAVVEDGRVDRAGGYASNPDMSSTEDAAWEDSPRDVGRRYTEPAGYRQAGDRQDGDRQDGDRQADSAWRPDSDSLWEWD